MNRDKKDKALFDYALKIVSQKQQFEQWLKIFFYLNERLHKEYDSIYQNSYYIKLHQLLTEGITYANYVLNQLKKVNNKKAELWYETLLNELVNIKEGLSLDELNFVEYKRHNYCHIFQNGYEIQINDKGLVNRSERSELVNGFYDLLSQFETEKEFDLNFTKKLHPKIIHFSKNYKAVKTSYNSSQAQWLVFSSGKRFLTQKFYLADSTQSAGIATDAWLQTVVRNLIVIPVNEPNFTYKTIWKRAKFIFENLMEENLSCLIYLKN
jgi:hypothetical protein